jgi:photosystem II stability/assembly factor-like uncharacterized protein
VSGWIQQGNSGVHLFALSAVGSTHAWTSSSVDLLLGTTDGGETWTNLADQTFTQLKFLTELEGWAFNLDGAYFSGDGGHTWTRKLALEGFDGVAGASFLSPSTGWVLTGDGMLHKTTDTGETWTQVSIGRFAREIAFVNASVGWMITDGPTSATESIWKSTDGGATWNQQFTFGNETTFLSQLSALSATQVRVGGIREEDGSNVGVILSTNDGGVTWNSVVNGIPALTAMHFATPDLGWMVAGTHVFRTVNGGGTWTEQELPELVQHSPSSPFSGLFAITFVDAQTGYIVGDNGIILKTSSGGE